MNRLFAVVVLSAALITSCARTGAVEVSQTGGETPTVAVVQATRADLSSDLLLTAEFEPFQEIDVMAKVSGYIKEIHVDIGDRVKEGQLLATLEIPEMQDDLTRAAAAIDEASAELATARDELQRAQSAHDMAHLSYSRLLDVSKREVGLVPQQDVDEVHSRDLVAEAQVAAAKSHITACEQRIRVSQADQARVKTLLQYGIITAPFTGVVTKRYANSGSLIQAGTASQSQAMPVIQLSENGLLRLVLPVPESAVPMIHLGEPLDVRVSALNRTFPGRIARFSEKVDQATRTMKTEVDVPNPTLVLVPGMYAEVDLITQQRRNVLSVPAEAVDGAGSAARVYTVQPSGAIRIVPVRLGVETARSAEILSGDLKEGDNVVVGSRASLKDGSKVQPRTIRLASDSTPKS
ncbi:MAG TPA: efflux RND transporter periplasmic adaptor subunit [Bryobacteraceae bacterium]|jgi:RND family efflux transporter MFP subunit